jgi:aspartyl aminopeptidase
MYGKLAWEKYNDEQINDIMTFNEGYKNYITKGKTERLCVSETVKLAMAHGYKELNEVDILKPGDKVYVTNMKKNIGYVNLDSSIALWLMEHLPCES